MGDEQTYPTSDKGCTYESCNRPAWSKCPDGRCLFHSPDNGRDEQKTARIVWETARAMAGDKEAKEANFRGWHFPEDPDGSAFTKRAFVGDAYFTDATFSGRVCFNGATFSKMACFNGAKFSVGALFDGAVFSEGASFMEAKFSNYASFHSAKFNGRSWFNVATFNGRTSFDYATFSKGALYPGVRFSEWTSFGGATFIDQADFDDASFSGMALFTDASFRGWASFDKSTFNGEARFNHAAFSLWASFKGATFDKKALFVGASSSPGATVEFDKPSRRRGLATPKGKCLARLYTRIIGRAYPFHLRREGETAYRFAKQAAQAAGNYTAAGDYHYAEQCAIEDKERHDSGWRPWRWAFWRWVGRWAFARGVFGYGEKISHPLIACLAVILFFAILCYACNGIAPGNPTAPGKIASASLNFEDSLYFSVVTFTTLGYGDFQPKPGYRLWAGIEAVLGAALMAVFVVCLTRKYIR